MARLSVVLTVLGVLVGACGDDDDQARSSSLTRPCADSPDEVLPTVVRAINRGTFSDLQACVPEVDLDGGFEPFIRTFPAETPSVFSQKLQDGLYLTGVAAESDSVDLVHEGPAVGTFQTFGALVELIDDSWRVRSRDPLYVLTLQPVDGRLGSGTELMEFAAEESSGVTTEPTARVWVDGEEVEVRSVRPLLDNLEDIGRYQFEVDLDSGNHWVAIYLEQPEGDRTGALAPLVVP